MLFLQTLTLKIEIKNRLDIFNISTFYCKPSKSAIAISCELKYLLEKLTLARVSNRKLFQCSPSAHLIFVEIANIIIPPVESISPLFEKHLILLTI